MAHAICTPGLLPNGLVIPFKVERSRPQELTYPFFCRNGKVYYRVDSQTSTLEIQNFDFMKSINHYANSTQVIIKEIKTGQAALIDKAEFDQVFKAVIAALA